MSAGKAKPPDATQDKELRGQIVLPRELRTRLGLLLERAEAGEEVVITRSGKPLARLQPSTGLSRTFLDTNILVYGDDGDEPEKQRKALELIRQHREQRTGVVSLQVLQEYFTAVTKKKKLDAGIARHKVEIFSRGDRHSPTARFLVLGCAGAADGQADRLPHPALRRSAAWPGI